MEIFALRWIIKRKEKKKHLHFGLHIFCEMSFVLKGFLLLLGVMQSFISLTALLLARVLTFSWITDVNTKEEEEKQEIDEIIKGAVLRPSSVHWVVHGMNILRKEEEEEEEGKKKNTTSVSTQVPVSLLCRHDFLFSLFSWNFVFRFGELLFFSG